MGLNKYEQSDELISKHSQRASHVSGLDCWPGGAREEDCRPRIRRRGPIFRGVESHCGVIILPARPDYTGADFLPCPCPVELLKPETEALPLFPSVFPPPPSAHQQVLSILPLKRLNPSSSPLHCLSLAGPQGAPFSRFSMEAAEAVS